MALLRRRRPMGNPSHMRMVCILHLLLERSSPLHLGGNEGVRGGGLPNLPIHRRLLLRLLAGCWCRLWDPPMGRRRAS